MLCSSEFILVFSHYNRSIVIVSFSDDISTMMMIHLHVFLLVFLLQKIVTLRYHLKPQTVICWFFDWYVSDLINDWLSKLYGRTIVSIEVWNNLKIFFSTKYAWEISEMKLTARSVSVAVLWMQQSIIYLIEI